MGFTVELEGIKELEHAWEQSVRELGAGVRRAVVVASREGVAEGLRAATWKDRTGEARRTLNWKLVKDMFGEVESNLNAPLARHGWLSDGTKPHMIYPKTITTGGPGRRRYAVLRFVAGDGSVVFRRQVSHPGTKGDGFGDKMQEKAKAVLRAEIDDVINRMLAKWS